MSVLNSISTNMRDSLPLCSESSVETVVSEINIYCENARSYFSATKGGMNYHLQTANRGAKYICDNPGAVVKTTFEKAKGVIHRFWKENGQICESLAAPGSKDALIRCYEGKFEGRLLKQVCSLKDAGQSSIPSVAQVIGGVVGGAGLLKAGYELRNGNKTSAFLWTAFGISAIVVSNLKI